MVSVTGIVDKPNASVIYVLGSPTADDGLVGKLEPTLLASPRGKVAVLFESVPGVFTGVVVAASVPCDVFGELGSWARLSVGTNIRVDILLDVSPARNVPLATDREPVP